MRSLVFKAQLVQCSLLTQPRFFFLFFAHSKALWPAKSLPVVEVTVCLLTWSSLFHI